MALSSPPSSLSPRQWVYDVFPSFSREDVGVTFISHFMKELDRKLITAFKDSGIRRSNSIGPEVVQAIRDSRVAVIILSKNYASSSSCLDELLEIVECKRESGKSLIPVFYDLEPRDVRKQSGEFGKAFAKTCENITEEKKNRWKNALTDVANLLGFCSMNRENDTGIIEHMIMDILKLTRSLDLEDFVGIDLEDFVGIEDHIAKMSVLLDLESEEVRMVGICGPSGIGKTTIARSLFGLLSPRFQHSIYLDRAFVSTSKEKISRANLDDFTMKLHLQELFLSKLLGQKDLTINHLGSVSQRLNHHKVLIFIDDLDDQLVLDSLVGQTHWFGRGSRIVVITKDKHLVIDHGIDCIYQVGLPSEDLALQMLCQSAFRMKYPPDGFKELAREAVLCAGNLPSSLNFFGSYLRGRAKKDWMKIMPRFRNRLDGAVERTLRGTEKILGMALNTDETAELHIHEDEFKRMCNLRSIKLEKCYKKREIRWNLQEDLPSLHNLRLLEWRDKFLFRELPYNFRPEILVKLQMRGSKLEKLWKGVHPLKALIVMDLEGSRNLTEIPDLSMANNLETLHLDHCSSLLELPSSSWNLYKLSKLSMKSCTSLATIPNGINLQSLDRLDLRGCSRLKSFPDFSAFSNVDHIEDMMSIKLLEGVQPQGDKFIQSFRAEHTLRDPRQSSLTPLMTMFSPLLTILYLSDIPSLMELPSSIQNLHKLEELRIIDCINLESLPTGINLKSLEVLDLSGCLQLKRFPDISTNISELYLAQTAIEEVPWWIEIFSRLSSLYMIGCNKLQWVSLNIFKLKHLETVDLSDCRALTGATWDGNASGVAMTADSIHSKLPVPGETSSPLQDNYVPKVNLNLINCFNLDKEVICQQESIVYKSMELSGEEVPSYFTHRSFGTSVTNIPLLITSPPQQFFKFKACVVVDSRSVPINYFSFNIKVCCRFTDKLGKYVDAADSQLYFSKTRLGCHLVIFACCFPLNEHNAPPAQLNYYQVDILFLLTSDYSQLKLKGCGIRLLEGLLNVCEGDSSNKVNLGGHDTEHNEECGESPSEMPSRNWEFDVFVSFCGEDVSKTFLSYFLKELDSKSIMAFRDNDIKRRRSVSHHFVYAIRDSRIAVVVFSNKYASSSWCLNELLEIMKCKEELGQMVIPIFYRLDPSNVKKQTGHFGTFFEKTCKNKTEEETQLLRRVLNDVANTLGYNSLTWDNEAKMIEEIANDVLRKLNLTPSKKFTPSMEQIDHDACCPRPEELEEMDGETGGLLRDAKSAANVKEAESGQGGTKFYSKLRVDEEISGEVNSDAPSSSHNRAENKMVDPAKEETKHKKVNERSTMVTYEKNMLQHQVFINFWGDDVSFSFISHLVTAFSREGVKVFVGKSEKRGQDFGKAFRSIEDSNIALVVFSSIFTESRWCLEELVKIKECMDEGRLLIIPIFYNVELSQVKQLEGDFGRKLWNLWRVHRDHRIIKWKDALESVASIKGYCLKEHSSESKFITFIVEEVRRISLQEGENLHFLPSTRRGKVSKFSTGKGEKQESFLNKGPFFGLEQRMKQIEQKLEFDCNETRVIGVVGMAGIGKTTLAMMLHEKWNCKFVRCIPLLSIRKMSEEYRPARLRKTLLEVLLGGRSTVINDQTTHESLEDKLLETKVFVVLDDVISKIQLEYLLGNPRWLKKGSKIVITSCDKSLIEEFVQDIYVVPPLNYGEALQLFSYHAFGDQVFDHTATSTKLCRQFVDCAGGNPKVIKLLGKHFYGRNEAEWNMNQEDLTYLGMVVHDIFRFSYGDLSEKQKEVFLDMACFFRSEDEYFAQSILDSGDHDAREAESEVRGLTHKGMIAISGHRVEMHDLLHLFGKMLSSKAFIEDNGGKIRLWYTQEIIDALSKQKDTKSIRGIFLDMYEVTKVMVLPRLTFIDMINLRYLNIYDSCCPRPCQALSKLHFPDGLEFHFEKVRLLHWVKFPLEEIPPDLRPVNLVDLRLSYSNVKRLWKGVKDTPRLKWVDLSHSSKLLNISALSKAESLERLNLEGCTSLDELPREMQNMKSLVYLNMRGCIRLTSLPKMNLISLKTLILSECSNLMEFQVISESLEVLLLDGTAIKELPLAIQKLRKLILLNLKNCKMLECLPNSLGQLKDLEELILSGCSRLKNLPDVRESMKHVQILLLDGTGVDEMPNTSCFISSEIEASADMLLQPSRSWPHSVTRVSSLRRLCLNGNDFSSLRNDIGQLYNLQWLEVKQCKNLRYVPMLPPRLQYFDANGCDSLERVANPLALLVLTDQAQAIFNFSNCNKLDQNAKDSIISYSRRRSQLMLGALTRYNEGSNVEALTGTCFPGWEVPEWFNHRRRGSVLDPKLPPHWYDNRFTGIALCAVISFSIYHKERSRLLVNCKCEFENEDGSRIQFNLPVGGWNELSKTQLTIESPQVFIGFTSRLDMSKQGGYGKEGCFCTKSFLEFEATYGTEKVIGFEVLQCGFSLIYATDEIQYQSYSCPTLQRDDNFLCEKKSDGRWFNLLENTGGESMLSSNNHSAPLENVEKPSLVGVERRLKQLERVLYATPGETRIVGVVGVPGVGKTTLANILFEKRGRKFPRSCFLKVSKEYTSEGLKRKFLEELLGHLNQNISEETTDEPSLDKPLQIKVFVVLDNVRDKKQLDFLRGNLNWIKKGSKIVVTSCDKSLVEGLVHDTYVVPQLNNREAFQVFIYHAFDYKICIPKSTFLLLSRMFVDNVRGNTLALKQVGSELRGKDEAYWIQKLQTMTRNSFAKIQDVWRFCINQLDEPQRDLLLDIACFFLSEDEYFVKSLVDSRDPAFVDAVNEVQDLAERFLITISDGRVEMNDGLSMFSKDLSSTVWCRLWKHREILDKLRKMKILEEANNVRGIFLDMSEVSQITAMECTTFVYMRNLRYLKIYESRCSPKEKSDSKLRFPDGFEFPLEEVRYFHWLKFPLEELPPDFRPWKLVDLRLPYSNIERLWEGVKEIPRLKCVDLSHSSKLLNISALSKAESLERLNLEGCTSLDELSREMQNMKSLVYLNMRGCIHLTSLPKMDLISLKTLILSGCSNLMEFQVISKSLEVLHLEGTAIKGLPLSIENLQKLILLNLKNCTLLEFLPNCISKLKGLEELILSGCSRLVNLPDVRHSMKHVQILLFEGTEVDEMPNISCFIGSEGGSSIDMTVQTSRSYCSPSEWPFGVTGVSSLRRLCLSGHNFVSLHKDIGQLSNLTWLDVKHCKKLISVPMLPPRLEYFDARDCCSLERVANPLAIQMLTEQIHATFNFFNCNKLDQDATNAIISYTRWKGQSILNALYRYNEGFTLEASFKTCLPGWEIPAWFSHQASGSSLEPKLPPHWCDGRFIGIALCAVILSTGCHNQQNTLSVKCNFEVKNDDGSHFRVSFPVGDWSEPDKTIESSHIYIGYVSKLDIEKLCLGNEEKCVHTEALFEFQVTDGTKELEGYKVLRCGFRLVYASDDLQVNSVKQGASPQLEEINNVSTRALLDEDELQMIWESLKGKGHIKQSKDEVEEDGELIEVNPPRSMCRDCNYEIEDGRSVNVSGVLWHPECFCCCACRKPIAIPQEVVNSRGKFHKSCYNRYCYVCKKKKLKVYNEHPFWKERYCPSHESDGTHKCFSCERLEPRGTNYVMLDDGRWLCVECMETTIMDTTEAQPLHFEIREFFEGLNMKIHEEFPLLLVDRHALNKAEKIDQQDHVHTRGLCLFEEQTVTAVSKTGKLGMDRVSIKLVSECEVTAILVLYRLPRLLTGYILAHEMMHAYLRLNGHRKLNKVLEEGICQVIGHMWLKSQTYTSADAGASSSASSCIPEFEKKLVEFYMNQIETDESPYFGNGFRKVNHMVTNSALQDTLKEILSVEDASRPHLRGGSRRSTSAEV